MSYSVLMYIYRKEGTSPEQFKQYYETKHVPVIQRLSGDLFPTLHSRHYIGYVPQSQSGSTPTPPLAADTPTGTGGDERVRTAEKLLAGSASAGDHVPMVVQGQPADFGWDVCTILTYTNETHFREFMAVLMDEKNAKTLADDEEIFMDRSKFKAVILGENLTTVNHSWTEKKT
ncbi:uncharacterized protein DNG_02780 [Cephalotrichum gorgonifer]|uniref:EthD domain-containing protein n=1 Tax=Cephalotrichum gorgonifer TaxID=2041049 RepID=A0AAE8MU54_9PEZI|nr:uncharacterized protein DNG_02780 [Cephalotrichum gorgonifer]